MEIKDFPATKLRKALGQIKRALNLKIGAVSKMKKDELVSKLTELKYVYDPNKKALITNSMIRKKSIVPI
jgi:hypothetical protein|tara:strand:- start:273 stop:482 length:210 start_codon:yes stop_codon:yes gene_type:complete